MRDYSINNELILSVPESFVLLNEAELGKMKYYDTPPDWCVKDCERHILISISYKHVNAFTAALAGSGDVAKNMDKTLKKAMEKYGYVRDGFLRERFGGRKASGFRYHYKTQGIEMLGESWSVKNKSNFYYIHCYYRADESGTAVKKVLESIRWREG